MSDADVRGLARPTFEHPGYSLFSSQPQQLLQHSHVQSEFDAEMWRTCAVFIATLCSGDRGCEGRRSTSSTTLARDAVAQAGYGRDEGDYEAARGESPEVHSRGSAATETICIAAEGQSQGQGTAQHNSSAATAISGDIYGGEAARLRLLRGAVEDDHRMFMSRRRQSSMPIRPDGNSSGSEASGKDMHMLMLRGSGQEGSGMLLPWRSQSSVPQGEDCRCLDCGTVDALDQPAANHSLRLGVHADCCRSKLVGNVQSRGSEFFKNDKVVGAGRTEAHSQGTQEEHREGAQGLHPRQQGRDRGQEHGHRGVGPDDRRGGGDAHRSRGGDPVDITIEDKQVIFAAINQADSKATKAAKDDWDSLTRKERLDLLEICTPDGSGLGQAVEELGGTVMRLGLHNGYDMSTKSVLNRALHIVREQRPRRLVASPLCHAGSVIQNMNMSTPEARERLRLKKKKTRRILEHIEIIFMATLKIDETECDIEQPRDNDNWKEAPLRRIREQFYDVDTDGCQWGLVSDRSGELLLKQWKISSSDIDLQCLRQLRQRSAYMSDVRSGRWGSFYFCVVRGGTWDAFEVECPVHRGTIDVVDSEGRVVRRKKQRCTRMRSWKVPVDTAERKQEQTAAILGLMQWCAMCGHHGVETPGATGKGAHKAYMQNKAEATKALKTKKEIEELRLSHGWSDDDDYNPIAAVGANALPGPAPEPGDDSATHEGCQAGADVFLPPSPVASTEQESLSD